MSAGTIRFLKAEAGVNLIIDTSTIVVSVRASLSNYGSGAGVQYLLDTTNQVINSLLLGSARTRRCTYIGLSSALYWVCPRKVSCSNPSPSQQLVDLVKFPQFKVLSDFGIARRNLLNVRI